MKRSLSAQKSILNLTAAGLTAALYVVLTLLSASLGLSSGVIQLRLSEALSVLPLFFPASVGGLTLGCFLANLLTGTWQDWIFGTLATFLGALFSSLLRKRSPFLSLLPPVLFNALIIPFVLSYAYGATEGIPFLCLTVGIGEFCAAYLLGLLLLRALRPVLPRLNRGFFYADFAERPPKRRGEKADPNLVSKEDTDVDRI